MGFNVNCKDCKYCRIIDDDVVIVYFCKIDGRIIDVRYNIDCLNYTKD